MVEFSWLIASGIFVAYCLLDWLFTIYTLSIVNKRKLLGANVCVMLYMLQAFGVVNYVSDWRYIVPMCVGGWLGTYFSIWFEERKVK